MEVNINKKPQAPELNIKFKDGDFEAELCYDIKMLSISAGQEVISLFLKVVSDHFSVTLLPKEKVTE